MLKDFFKRLMRGKTIDPQGNGGWDVLSGLPNWKRGNEIWQERMTPELEAVYRTQVIVYACVRKICISAQEAPLCVGREEIKGGKKSWKDLPDHPVAALLKQPNPQMHTSEFLWHFLAHLLLTGKSYVWKWRNKAGYVAECWPVPSSWVRPVYGAAGLTHYEIFQGANKTWLAVPLEDVVRCMFPDPSNLSEGLGPLQAAQRDVQTDDGRGDYIIEMYENARTPGMVLFQPNAWSEEQKQDARAAISQGLGRGRRGKPLFVEGEGARVEQQVPLKDLDWPGLSALSETRICAAFGVPTIIIGLRSGLDASTYSNYEQALKSFMQGTMVPLWSMLDRALTKGLIVDEDLGPRGEEVYSDTSNVRALQEDEDKRADRAGKLVAAGLMKVNEGRAMCGLDPLPPEQGDVFLIPMNLVATPGGIDTSAPPPPDTGANANAVP